MNHHHWIQLQNHHEEEILIGTVCKRWYGDQLPPGFFVGKRGRVGKWNEFPGCLLKLFRFHKDLTSDENITCDIFHLQPPPQFLQVGVKKQEQGVKFWVLAGASYWTVMVGRDITSMTCENKKLSYVCQTNLTCIEHAILIPNKSSKQHVSFELNPVQRHFFPMSLPFHKPS